jgi:hypothetical protein
MQARDSELPRPLWKRPSIQVAAAALLLFVGCKAVQRDPGPWPVRPGQSLSLIHFEGQPPIPLDPPARIGAIEGNWIRLDTEGAQRWMRLDDVLSFGQPGEL